MCILYLHNINCDWSFVTIFCHSLKVTTFSDVYDPVHNWHFCLMFRWSWFRFCQETSYSDWCVVYFLGARAHSHRQHLLALSCLTVHMYKCSTHWTYFYQIFYWGLSWESVKKLHIWLKLDKNTGHLTQKPKYFLLLLAI